MLFSHITGNSVSAPADQCLTLSSASVPHQIYLLVFTSMAQPRLLDPLTGGLSLWHPHLILGYKLI